jgi:hypothetical protein
VKKKLTYGIYGFIFAFSFLLTACEGADQLSTSEDRVISNLPSESEVTPAGAAFSTLANAADTMKPLIDIGPSYTLVGLANINFDLERNEEQVLAVRDKNAADSQIQIMVAAYDNVLEKYRIVFEEYILAVNQRTLNLSFLDIVGDHNLEIICRGMDLNGDQTLDIFHRTAAPSGFGLYYSNIFSVAISGSIEFIELERSGAYQVGQSNGESFPIVTQAQDEASENILDLVQTTYYWRFTDNSYVEGKIEKIPGEEVEQQQLKELYRKNAAAFADFLYGNWYLADAAGEAVAGTVILHFNTANSSFTYYTGGLQESYDWISTYKVLVSRVEINGENELVPFIRKQFYLQVESLDSVRIRGNDPWSGLYRRLSDQIARSLTSQKTAEDYFPELSGLFYSDSGVELLFEGTTFRLVEAGKVLQGGYAMYSAAGPVLELRIIDGAGLISDSRRYSFTYNEERRDDKVFRTLSLVPGIVGIYGFEATADISLRYEQIVSADDE